MSWNGNDLFNSTLMGGMPSGADPHQYLTTDGNGKPHWEDKLAYEDVQVVEVLKEITVTAKYPGPNFFDVELETELNAGDVGVVYVNGDAREYFVEIENGATRLRDKSAPTSDVALIDGEGDLMMILSPGTTYTISITKTVTTIKTIDPKYLPSGSGGGLVVNATLTPTDDTGMVGTVTFDKTVEETLAAVKAGEYVVCHCSPFGQENGNYVLRAVHYREATETVQFAFQHSTLSIAVVMGSSSGEFVILE